MIKLFVLAHWIVAAAISILSVSGCIAPPIRNSFGGAPGRHVKGDSEVRIAAGAAAVEIEEAYVSGEIGGAYSVSDQVTVDFGGSGGGAPAGEYGNLNGYGGLRISFPKKKEIETGLFGDVELGVGIGAMIIGEGLLYGGGYTGAGVAYRWDIVSLYSRFRIQEIGGMDMPATTWISLAVGNEFKLGKAVRLYWSASESFFGFEETGHAPAGELGLIIRL